jgi:hypothetical protein
MDLVFDRSVLAPARFGVSEQGEPQRGGGRDRLFGIDVFAGRQRLGEDGDALLGRGRIEKDRPGRIRKRGIQIGGPFRDAMGARDLGKTLAVAAHQQQARNQTVIPEREAAFIDDRDEGIGQMLSRADAAGRAIDDDSDRLRCHAVMRGLGKARAGGGETMLCRLHPCPRSGRQRCPATSCA